MSKKTALSKVLKEFRVRFDLTQLSAALWLYLPAGTYRDYEQSRSVPSRIVEAGINARIAAFAHDYEQYLAEQQKLETVAH